MLTRQDLAIIATRGFAEQKHAGYLERTADMRKRIDMSLEGQEELRMVELAMSIDSEALFQKILSQVDPKMRKAVEARLRPHTKIPDGQT